jgi:hypothetical protein
MPRIFSTALVAASLSLGGGTAATAAPAQHDTFVESWEGQQHLTAADNVCGPWAATLQEARSGDYRIVEAPGGQSEGEFHVNGAVDGRVVLTPDDPALPTYSGTYREKVNAIVTGLDEEGGDLVRVGHFRLRTPLTGSDGSALVLAMSGRVTVNALGELVVEWFSVTCA